MHKQITLTQVEIDEIKDEARFREKVMLHLKQMSGIPEKITKLETKVALIIWGIPIIAGIAGFIIKLTR